MRAINNFEKKGGLLVAITDSLTGIKSMSSWSGNPKRFWVRARYFETDGVQMPRLDDPFEVIELGADEPWPEGKSGWCRAHGFFG